MSAGRVQSAALKIICDREKDIQKFVPKEFWNINVLLFTGEKSVKSNTFSAKLYGYKGKKFVPGNAEEADKVVQSLKAGNFLVEKIEKNDYFSVFYVNKGNKGRLIGKKGKNIKNLKKLYGNIVVKEKK